MEFFIDRNVPEALARMLGHYDRSHTVTYHDDRFEPRTPDTQWLSEIAEWDPIPAVVSGDGRILRNPAELQVLGNLPITFFLLARGWVNMPWHEQAWKMIKVWPLVVQHAAPTRPAIFRIPVSAQKIEFVRLTSELGRSGKKR